MNGYNLLRNWYNFKFTNPSKVKALHSDFYCYLIDLWNRLGQKNEFGLPTTVTMETLGIGSYNTYKKTLNDLIEFGFVEIIANSKNQHQSKIIALSKNDKATDKALDKANTSALSKNDKALDKATDKASDKATDKATDTINKQLNNITNKQINKRKKEKEYDFSKVDSNINNEYLIGRQFENKEENKVHIPALLEFINKTFRKEFTMLEFQSTGIRNLNQILQIYHKEDLFTAFENMRMDKWLRTEVNFNCVTFSWLFNVDNIQKYKNFTMSKPKNPRL